MEGVQPKGRRISHTESCRYLLSEAEGLRRKKASGRVRPCAQGKAGREDEYGTAQYVRNMGYKEVLSKGGGGRRRHFNRQTH